MERRVSVQYQHNGNLGHGETPPHLGGSGRMVFYHVIYSNPAAKACNMILELVNETAAGEHSWA